MSGLAIGELDILDAFGTTNGITKEFAERLWKGRHLSYSLFLGDLCISDTLAGYLNPRTVLALLTHSPEKQLSKIRYIDFVKFEFLGYWAPGLFLRYCPNLSSWSVDAERFYDQKLGSFKVNSTITRERIERLIQFHEKQGLTYCENMKFLVKQFILAKDEEARDDYELGQFIDQLALKLSITF